MPQIKEKGMTTSRANRRKKKAEALRDVSAPRTWKAPESGIAALVQMQQRHQQEANQMWGMLARDANVPEGASVGFDPERGCFVEQEAGE